jgi:hypothetical protein
MWLLSRTPFVLGFQDDVDETMLVSSENERLNVCERISAHGEKICYDFKQP